MCACRPCPFRSILQPALCTPRPHHCSRSYAHQNCCCHVMLSKPLQALEQAALAAALCQQQHAPCKWPNLGQATHRHHSSLKLACGPTRYLSLSVFLFLSHLNILDRMLPEPLARERASACSMRCVDSQDLAQGAVGRTVVLREFPAREPLVTPDCELSAEKPGARHGSLT